MKWMLILPVLLMACGGSVPVAESAEHRACYADALVRANAFADKACPGEYESCAAADEVEAILLADLEACDK